ncbi:MAG: hypothetical protein AB7G23_09115 [Vicinamibacterales bacterium]
MATRATATPGTLECCPTFEQKPTCDTMDFRYRLPFRRPNSRVDVILHFRLERCSGPLVQGDLLYSTTLFPGERVRLFTSDRHSRWSFDSATQLSYRHETTSEESFYTWGMARAMSDLDVSESGSASSSFSEDWASGGGGASVNLGIIEIGGGGGGGSYDAASSSSFARNLSRHAEASSSYVAAGVRAQSATAVGEVETRSHAEGESESHFESSSREFRNPNQCHAVSYLFYKINKTQRVRFRLVAIERTVADPAAPVVPDRRVTPNVTGQVLVRPQAVLATSKDRVEVERIARQAAVERERAAAEVTVGVAGVAGQVRTQTIVREPVKIDVRQAELKAVDQELAAAGLLDAATGKPTEKIIAELSWEREEQLPTPGVLVRGCLDECSTCEPALERRIALDLERQALENELLKRRIDLLDQAQEYRCCPVGEAEPAEEGGEEEDEDEP